MFAVTQKQSEVAAALKVVLPNSGHMVNMKAPDEVNELLGDIIVKLFKN